MPLISDMDRDADELQALLSGTAITRYEVEDAMKIDHFAIPQEASFDKPKRPEKELAVLAFYSKGEAIVVWCNDGHIRWEIGEVGSSEVASYILDENAPDHGIYVWEGTVYCRPYPNYDGEYDDPEYKTIQWRQPTEEEWEAMMEQRNPFEPKPKEVDDWSWGRKTEFQGDN